jgi:hypothetical protein
MYIKFANTVGYVSQILLTETVAEQMSETIRRRFEPFNELLTVDDLVIGAVRTYHDGILIVDRDVNHETSQLDGNDVIMLLRQLLLHLYPLEDRVDIFLPRFYSNLMVEAKFQYNLQNMFVNSDAKTPAANSNAANDTLEYSDHDKENTSFVCSLSMKNLKKLNKIKIVLHHV